MGEDIRHCVYCGDWYECIDHCVPIDWSGNSQSYAAGDIVAACRQCARLLARFPKLSLTSRARYLRRAYQKRAAKWLRVPPWREEELQELGYGLQTQVRRALTARSVYLAKLHNLDLVEHGYEPIPIC
jgi:hypothetical protein